MKRWFGEEDSRCPSCLIEEEGAGHLCRCTNADRRKLLEDCTTDLLKWMSIGDNTHPDIIWWVERYILGGTGSHDIPESIAALVASQELIGWRNFMEGRVSIHFHRLQFIHLVRSHSLIMASNWMKIFISKLLHITHSQWIFRNFMLHKKSQGLLRMKEKVAIQLHIEALSLCEKCELPEESRFLLEFDIGGLLRADVDTQSYWVLAVEAARTALHGASPPGLPTDKTQPNQARRTRPRRDSSLTMGTWWGTTAELGDQSRPSPAAIFGDDNTNRTRKPD